MPFTRIQIEESIHTLSQHVSSIMSSDVNTAVTFFDSFVSFCESDEVITTITSPLKEVDVPFDEWWNRTYPNGRRIFDIPRDTVKKCAFLYQLCIKIYNRERGFDYLTVGLEYFGSSHVNDNIRQFNPSVIQPLFNCFRQTLNRLLSEIPDDSPQLSLPTIHVSGDNTRVNINSVDRSTNIVNTINMNRFNEIEDALRQIQDERTRTECLNSLNDLKESVGTTSFVEKYRHFIATAADHMTLISPFIGYLSSLLPS